MLVQAQVLLASLTVKQGFRFCHYCHVIWITLFENLIVDTSVKGKSSAYEK